MIQQDLQGIHLSVKSRQFHPRAVCQESTDNQDKTSEKVQAVGIAEVGRLQYE